MIHRTGEGAQTVVATGIQQLSQPGPEPGPDVAQRAVAVAVPGRRQPVGALSERQRDAILLHYGLGFTAAEAAEVMGNQDATVRSQLRTGRRRLATLLKLLCPKHPDGKNPS